VEWVFLILFGVVWTIGTPATTSVPEGGLAV